MRFGRSVGLVSTFALVGFAWVSAAPNAPVADAAMAGDLEAVRSLLDGGSDPDVAHGDGMTGLHWASQAHS